MKRPLFLMPVPAGFPSPADDYLEGRLDLNEHLIEPAFQVVIDRKSTRLNSSH